MVAARRWRLTGLLFILGSVLVNIPYAMLISTFDYPDILRESAEAILTRFQAGGSSLIFTWLAFAWTGLPLLFGIVLLHGILDRADTPYLIIGTASGVIGEHVGQIFTLVWIVTVSLAMFGSAVFSAPSRGSVSRRPPSRPWHRWNWWRRLFPASRWWRRLDSSVASFG